MTQYIDSVTLVCIGRFHHFHLARQMEMYGFLSRIYTGYPSIKLRDESGISADKIHSFPWLVAPYMARGRFKLDQWEWLNREWSWQAHQTLDIYVAQQLRHKTTVVALSGSGLIAGQKAQKVGGNYICDRGSSHIRKQDELLREEYSRWNIPYHGIDPRKIEKEEAEYEVADYITVPSEFVRKSFIEKGISQEKICKIPYGSRLDRFQPVAQPNPDEFRLLFVGSVSLRKGFLDLLQAFKSFRHPRKKLTVIGSITSEIRPLLGLFNTEEIEYLGVVPNIKLAEYFSRAHVFVLPSIEEGLALVLGEAMACGCPVIASENTGAADLIQDGCEGFIVPIRQPNEIVHSLNRLASNPELRQYQSTMCLNRVQTLGGWNQYGEQWVKLLQNMDDKI